MVLLKLMSFLVMQMVLLDTEAKMRARVAGQQQDMDRGMFLLRTRANRRVFVLQDLDKPMQASNKVNAI